MKKKKNQPVVSKEVSVERKKQAIELLKNYASGLKATVHPDSIFDSTAKKMIQVKEGNNHLKEIEKIISDDSDKLIMALGVGAPLVIAETVDLRYQPLVIKFAQQLIEEYSCTTPSEVARAEVAANAYVRIIEYSKQLNAIHNIEFLSNEKNGYYGLLSKELDRAERHFHTALAGLKTMRVTPLTVQVTSQNAFIADKQQINSLTSSKNENNEVE